MGKRIQCGLCGDIIKSRYRHDFKYCKCGNLSVDGGNNYLKVSFIKNNWTILEEKENKQDNTDDVEYKDKENRVINEEGYLI